MTLYLQVYQHIKIIYLDGKKRDGGNIICDRILVVIVVKTLFKIEL